MNERKYLQPSQILPVLKNCETTKGISDVSDRQNMCLKCWKMY